MVRNLTFCWLSIRYPRISQLQQPWSKQSSARYPAKYTACRGESIFCGFWGFAGKEDNSRAYEWVNVWYQTQVCGQKQGDMERNFHKYTLLNSSWSTMPSLYYNVAICGHSSIPGAAAPSKIFLCSWGSSQGWRSVSFWVFWVLTAFSSDIIFMPKCHVVGWPACGPYIFISNTGLLVRILFPRMVSLLTVF